MIVRSAALRVAERIEGSVMDQLEPRRLFDSCSVLSTSIEYFGNSTADNVTIDVSSGTISIKNNGSTICQGVEATVTSITLHGGDGDDTLSGAGATIGVTIIGDAGRDTIIGSTHADSLNGGSDEDTLQGGLGTDTLNGGGGARDWVDYSDKGTTAVTVDLETASTGGTSGENDALSQIYDIIGGSGNDTLIGDDNTSRISGGDGVDSIVGNGGNDTLDGGPGNDIIRAGDGADSIGGGTGNDVIAAGNGDDIMDGGSGADSMTGDAGSDTADYHARTNQVVVTIGDGNANDGESGEGDYIPGSTENVIGGSGNDNFTGDSGNNSLSGGSGNDILSGGAGSDTLNGDSGNDTLYGGTNADFIDGGAGDDSLFGNDGTSDDLAVDTLDGGSGTDTHDTEAYDSYFNFP